jgi:hypothetical protein
MRLRLAIGVIAVLMLLLGITFVAQQRARAEHVRVALFQAQAAAEAENKANEIAPAGKGIVGANSTPGYDFNNPTLRGAAPPAAIESAVPGATAQPPAAGVGIAPLPGGLPGSAGGPTVQVTAPNPYGPVMMAPMAVSPWPVDDPEMNELAHQDQQLEQEVQSLVRQLADSDDDKSKAELKDKLAATLDKQFDAQQKLRQLEISRIEARVKKLQDLVRKRTESRRKIIDNRMEQLLNEAEGLEWGNAARAGSQGIPQLFPGSRPGMRPAGVPPATTRSPRGL